MATLLAQVACMHDVHIGIDIGWTQGAGVQNTYKSQSRDLEFPGEALHLAS
jgi:hypothetical protein